MALQRVASDWRRVWDHENLGVLRGYPFPDPQALAKDLWTSYAAKVYILGWLALRPAWISRLADVSMPAPRYPNPQQWKDLIKTDVARALNFSHRIKGSDESANK